MDEAGFRNDGEGWQAVERITNPTNSHHFLCMLEIPGGK
jgi:hypothetical protein